MLSHFTNYFLNDSIFHRFDTTSQGLVFSDQYIQVTVGVASEHLYGLGEHNHKRFKHDMNWKQWTIFTRDEAPIVSNTLIYVN